MKPTIRRFQKVQSQICKGGTSAFLLGKLQIISINKNKPLQVVMKLGGLQEY